jgi:hypothetical protein
MVDRTVRYRGYLIEIVPWTTGLQAKIRMPDAGLADVVIGTRKLLAEEQLLARARRMVDWLIEQSTQSRRA